MSGRSAGRTGVVPHMRKTLLAVVGSVAALVVMGLVIWHQTPAPPPAMSLGVETVQYDFGRVRGGTVIQRDFEMRNDGADPRILSSVSTSCSCTKVGSNVVHAIPPHSVSPLPVEVDLKGAGRFLSKVFVGFANETSFVVVLTGEVVQQVPPDLGFDAAPGQTFERSFSVQSVTATPLVVKSLKCDRPEFEASLIESKAATSPADPQVLVRFHPSASSTGTMAGELRIETDDSVQPVKVVALNGSIHQAADAR